MKGTDALSQNLVTRRGACQITFQSTVLHPAVLCSLLAPQASVAADGDKVSGQAFGVSDEVVSSLVYERFLGGGSFKTVYLVSTSTGDGLSHRYALAVQKLRDKSDVKDGLRGIQVSEQLQQLLMDDEEKRYFETTIGWWFQTAAPSTFQMGGQVFASDKNVLDERTCKPPSRFLGYKYLVALKPVYDMDLKTFSKRSKVMHPVGGSDEQRASPLSLPTYIVAGVPLTEAGAIQLALEMMHAGRLMHATGLVHRDIKPKNIMLKDGHPIIIDFGFSHFVDDRPSKKKSKSNATDDSRICIEQPGIVKGEPEYVLARDVAAFQGCREGDAYAMGKTLYEIMFCDELQNGSASGKPPITVGGAQRENERFRAMLDEASSHDGGPFSRFRMSKTARDALLTVIRGLCRDEKSISFADAETFLSTLSIVDRGAY
jgi:serine/threonine protein kinase